VRSKQSDAALLPASGRWCGPRSSLPIFGVRSMPQFLTGTVSLYEMGASLVGTFAVMAMLLAAVGIYGVLHLRSAADARDRHSHGFGRAGRQVLGVVLRRSLAVGRASRWESAWLLARAGLTRNCWRE